MQNTLLELQTGQVAFISGLMAGFGLTVAVHLLRHGLTSRIERLVFSFLIITTLLFLLALYVDVRLTIELAGHTSISSDADRLISSVRTIGTNSATAAFALFVISVGLLGWIERPSLGVVSTLVALAVLITLGFIWFQLLGLDAILK
ncbi:MAG: hypothetical protein KTR18_08070 [Acidiferrobacterales bacterium]|nr:hypothetical protein [Acidiferrobacterales bacterium]